MGCLSPEARAQRFQFRKSILDFVSDDTRKLQGDLGPTDQRKLDEYLDSVRACYPNKAIVISMTAGPQKAIDDILAIPEIEKLLDTHYLFAATLGEFYRQLGKKHDAKPLLQRAMTLTHSPSEKALLDRKLHQMC